MRVIATYDKIDKKTDKTKTQLQYLASIKIFKLTTVTAVPATITPREGRPCPNGSIDSQIGHIKCQVKKIQIECQTPSRNHLTKHEAPIKQLCLLFLYNSG